MYTFRYTQEWLGVVVMHRKPEPFESFPALAYNQPVAICTIDLFSLSTSPIEAYEYVAMAVTLVRLQVH
jgi:hypothetical protein